MIDHRIIDAHCHLHEFSDEEIRALSTLGVKIIAVSDDLNSSMRTLSVVEEYKWVIPAVGMHPWRVSTESLGEASRIGDLILDKKSNVRVVGEVGLDKKFKPETFAYQLQVFNLFIEIAEDIKAVLNVHAAGAWREVIRLLTRSDIPTAIVHWYTGPQELLKEIAERGMYITVNPAITIQQKQKDIVSVAPLDIILVESDAPYTYKGLSFHPRNVFDVLNHIANVKGMTAEEVYEVVADNCNKFVTKYLEPSKT